MKLILFLFSIFFYRFVIRQYVRVSKATSVSQADSPLAALEGFGGGHISYVSFGDVDNAKTERPSVGNDRSDANNNFPESFKEISLYRKTSLDSLSL